MALTITPVAKSKLGVATGGQQNIYMLTFTGTYATPGETLTTALLGMTLIRAAYASMVGGFVIKVEPTTPTADGFVAGTVQVMFGDNNNAADGPLIEVANGAYDAAFTAGRSYLTVYGR